MSGDSEKAPSPPSLRDQHAHHTRKATQQAPNAPTPPPAPQPVQPPAGGAANPGSGRNWQSIVAFFVGLAAVIGAIFKAFSWLSSHSSPSNQALGRYQCIRGHVEHATHWTGPRKCSVCDQTMFWKG